MALLWRDFHERYQRFHLLIGSDAGRPYLRALWPIVVLIIAMAAFAKAATGRRHSHGPAQRWLSRTGVAVHDPIPDLIEQAEGLFSFWRYQVFCDKRFIISRNVRGLRSEESRKRVSVSSLAARSILLASSISPSFGDRAASRRTSSTSARSATVAEALIR